MAEEGVTVRRVVDTHGHGQRNHDDESTVNVGVSEGKHSRKSRVRPSHDSVTPPAAQILGAWIRWQCEAVD
jgi:hypothetical protein